jgi:hypothetical protein
MTRVTRLAAVVGPDGDRGDGCRDEGAGVGQTNVREV